jgi:hypothetical protein
VSRPKPTILLSQTAKNWNATEILAAQGVFVVAYNGKPIGMRNNGLLDHRLKYHRTAFINGGQAFCLARKLNRQFGTDQFGVLHYSAGEPLTEAEYYIRFGVLERASLADG